jgi:hypothetical protein
LSSGFHAVQVLMKEGGERVMSEEKLTHQDRVIDEKERQ